MCIVLFKGGSSKYAICCVGKIIKQPTELNVKLSFMLQAGLDHVPGGE